MDTETKVTIVIIIALAIFAMWLIKKIVQQAFNLYRLFREWRHSETLPRKGENVILNQDTGKLENSTGEPILPFK